MADNDKYRPLETTLGFYGLGEEFTIFANRASGHAHYTAVHEHTHAILGWSTSFGIFQKFMVHLNTRGPSNAAALAGIVLDKSLQHVRVVHEAAATYREFSAAKNDAYAGITEMEASLPDDYKAWRNIFEDCIDPTLGESACQSLSIHLASLAMNTNILLDQKDTLDDFESSFEGYLNSPVNSPNKRLELICSFIRGKNQKDLFSNFLGIRAEVPRSKMHEYETEHTVSVRKQRLEFAKRGQDAFDKDAAAIPFGRDARARSISLIKEANDLVARWTQYFLNNFDERISYSFRNTDDAEVDELIEYERTAFELNPQSGLYPFSPKSLEKPDEYLISLVEWDQPEPFVICSWPLRELHQGQSYVRFIPLRPLAPTGYCIVENLAGSDLLERRYGGILMRGINYRQFSQDTKAMISNSNVAIVFWESWNQFKTGGFSRERAEVGILDLREGLRALCIRCEGDVIHLLLSVRNNNLSMILSELERGWHSMNPLRLGAESRVVFDCISANASFLLG